MSNILKKNYLNLTLMFVTANYYLLHHFATNTFSPSAFGDRGWGSIWTIVFILSGQALAVLMAIKSDSKKEMFDWLILTFIYQVYCYREGDMHRVSPDWHNVTNLKFYTVDNAPMALKCFTAAVLILFAVSAIYLLIRYTPKIFGDFLRAEPYAVSFALWGIYLLGSQFLDKSSFFNKSPVPIIKNIEEMGELTASLFALLSISQFAVQKLRLKKQ